MTPTHGFLSWSIAGRAAVCIVMIGSLFGCGSHTPAVLAIVGPDTLRVTDYERSYALMRNSTPESDQEKTEFLDLLVDFTLKLKEAQARELEKLPAIRSDINRYRDQLAISFLIEQRVVDQAIRTLYERRLDEVNASHIVVRYHRDAENRIDSASTYLEAQELLKRVLASPEPFDTLVMRYSEDASKEKTRGSIGWNIAGTSLPNLDDMLYSLKVGEISPRLLKSSFGYHIIKLTGRQKARLRLRASQILYRLDINNPLDTSAGYARLSLVLDSLNRGLATFEELARRNSQDPVSGAAGGDLGWVERGTNLEPRFEEALFNLPTHQTSSVVRSAFGLHIIRVTDEAPARSIDMQRNELRAIVMKERFTNDYTAFMKELRVQHGFQTSPDVIKRIISRVDSTMTTSTPNWSAGLTGKELDAFLFRIRERTYSVREAVKEIASNPQLQMRRFTPESLDSISAIIADNVILLIEGADMEKQSPEFVRLIRQFKESAIVSRLETDEVFDKVTVSDNDARAYYEAHPDEFQWPDRVNLSEIWVYSDVQAKRLVDSLNAGADFTGLASRHTRRSGMFEKGGSWGWQPVERSEITRIAQQMDVGTVSGVIKEGNGYSIIKVDGKDAARLKTFEESRAEAIAKAKEAAVAVEMRRFLDRLRRKYNVTTFPERLSEAFRDAE